MVNTISKNMAVGKKLKRGIFAVGCMIIATFAIYAAVWNYNKSLSEEKFEKGVEACDFAFDEMNGYYAKEDADIDYILPDQKMPGLFDFRLDFHAKQITAYIPVKDGKVTISMDERRKAKIKIISLSSEWYGADRDMDKINKEHRDQIEAVKAELERIYKTVYR